MVETEVPRAKAADAAEETLAAALVNFNLLFTATREEAGWRFGFRER